MNDLAVADTEAPLPGGSSAHGACTFITRTVWGAHDIPQHAYACALFVHQLASRLQVATVQPGTLIWSTHLQLAPEGARSLLGQARLLSCSRCCLRDAICLTSMRLQQMTALEL